MLGDMHAKKRRISRLSWTQMGLVMVEHGIYNRVGEPPKAEKNASDFGVIGADDASLHAENAVARPIEVFLKFGRKVWIVRKKQERSDMAEQAGAMGLFGDSWRETTFFRNLLGDRADL